MMPLRKRENARKGEPWASPQGNVRLTMIRLNPCRWCGNAPCLDRFKPPASDWVYVVACSSSSCDNAECGDSPEEAARLWNFANPDWSGNVPAG